MESPTLPNIRTPGRLAPGALALALLLPCLPRPAVAAHGAGSGPDPGLLPEAPVAASDPREAPSRTAAAPALVDPGLDAGAAAPWSGAGTVPPSSASGEAGGARSAETPGESAQGTERAGDAEAKKEEAGPRIVERRPEGGLAYRITMSATATAERPQRLIVWLHPSGGLYNAHVEGLAPVMLRQGFALMVMTDKDPRGWTYDDARKLLGVSLPDAGTIPGIDLRRPLLMGFSAGGQVALTLWRTKPELYGGIIIDAAYPADTVEGKDVVFGPPDSPAIKEVPVLVYVGGEDQLLWVWEQVEEPYKEAGIPLEVHVVPGLGHRWLFGEKQVAALEDWLSRLPPLGGGEGQTVAPPQEEPAPAVQP